MATSTATSSNPPSSVPETCKVVTAVTIAKSLLGEITKDLETLNYKPKLVGLLANEDEHAHTYAEYSAKTCRENGFDFDLRIVSKTDIEEAILSANTDDSVHGIIVYYPIFPSPRQDQYIQQLVALNKDVEGLSHQYIFNMYQNIRFLDAPINEQKSILPCTPLAVVKVLEYLHVYNPVIAYGNRLFGKTITVINRSEVVGRPLAALLANDGAKVYSVDLDGIQIFGRGRGIKSQKHETRETSMQLDDCLALSDVVITGVPNKNYKVDPALLRDGAVCVNFSSDRNFDGPLVKQHASIYVPAIGKVTIAVLLRNLIRLCRNRELAETSMERHIERYTASLEPAALEPAVMKPVTLEPASSGTTDKPAALSQDSKPMNSWEAYNRIEYNRIGNTNLFIGSRPEEEEEEEGLEPNEAPKPKKKKKKKSKSKGKRIAEYKEQATVHEAQAVTISNPKAVTSPTAEEDPSLYYPGEDPSLYYPIGDSERNQLLEGHEGY